MKKINQKLRILLLLCMLCLGVTGYAGSAAAAPRLSTTSMNVLVNTTNTLKLYGASGKITWSVSKPSLVSLNKKSGNTVKVKTKGKIGKAYVRAKNGKKTYTCKVNVMKYTCSSSTTIAVGANMTLKFSNAKVKWSSSNKKIATVNKNGKVVGKKKGKCYIHAVIGNNQYRTLITVVNPVLDKKSITLKVGGYDRLCFNTKGDAVFKAEDPNIIHFSPYIGKYGVYVYGDREGSTIISATIYGKTYYCKVKVTGHRSSLDASSAGMPNGIYRLVNDGSKNGYSWKDTFVGSVAYGKSYWEYFFIYNGKAYLPYELPKSIELALLRNDPVFANFLNNYASRYQAMYSDPTIAGLMAISRYINDQNWIYTTNGASDPIFGMMYEQSGLCVHFANTFQYLCYLMNVQCAVIDCSYNRNYVDHDLNAVYYKGYWYCIEPQAFLKLRLEQTTIEYFGNAKLAYIDAPAKNYSNVQQNRCLSVLPDKGSLLRTPGGESLLQADIRRAAYGIAA